MIFRRTRLADLVEVHPRRHEDARGAFARLVCEREFAAAGLHHRFVQTSASYNRARHTLRGMHYQAGEHAEIKLVRCTRGRIYDVAVDLRPTSPSYRGWLGRELSPEEGVGLYIPAGFAHGFLTLEPDSEVLYQMGSFYEPGHGRGLRWNDPGVDVEWPAEPAVIAPRDASYPDHDWEAPSEGA